MDDETRCQSCGYPIAAGQLVRTKDLVRCSPCVERAVHNPQATPRTMLNSMQASSSLPVKKDSARRVDVERKRWFDID